VVLLGQEYIVAVLNQRTGARASADVTRALHQARVLLHCMENSTHSSEKSSEGISVELDSNQVLLLKTVRDLYSVLFDWNSGQSGVEDCRELCKAASTQVSSSGAERIEESTDTLQNPSNTGLSSKVSQISPLAIGLTVGAVVLGLILIMVVIVYRRKRQKKVSEHEGSFSQQQEPLRQQSRDNKALVDPLFDRISDTLPQKKGRSRREEEDEVNLQQQEQTLQPETITIQITEEDENLHF